MVKREAVRDELFSGIFIPAEVESVLELGPLVLAFGHQSLRLDLSAELTVNDLRFLERCRYRRVVRDQVPSP